MSQRNQQIILVIIFILLVMKIHQVYSMEMIDTSSDKLCAETIHDLYHRPADKEMKQIASWLSSELSADQLSRMIQEDMQYVLKAVAEYDTKNDALPLLHKAAQQGRMDVMRWLVNHGLDFQKQNSSGANALMWAADREVVDFFCELNLNPNQANSFGWAPIHQAAADGREEALVALARYKANINARNREGKTPLFLAKSAKITLLLLGMGALPRLKDNFGATALHELMTNSHDRENPSQIASVLLELGVPAYGGNTLQQTPMHCVCSVANTMPAEQLKSLIQFLLQHGASPHAKDAFGKMPFEILCEVIGRTAQYASICNLFADYDYKYTFFRDRLLTRDICPSNVVAELQKIIAMDNQINYQMPDGGTLLMAAAQSNTEIAFLFISKGADVDIQNHQGQTALSLAPNLVPMMLAKHYENVEKRLAIKLQFRNQMQPHLQQ